MLMYVSRVIGVGVCVFLMAVGAETLMHRILSWKDAFDRKAA